MPKDQKAEYSKSTEQLYKESLHGVDQDENTERDEGRVMVVEGNDVSAYVGVDPVYQNYANETEKPYKPGDGTADAAIVDEFVAAQTYTVSTVEGEQTKSDGAPATAEGTEVDPASTTDEGTKPTKPTLATPAKSVPTKSK